MPKERAVVQFADGSGYVRLTDDADLDRERRVMLDMFRFRGTDPEAAEAMTRLMLESGWTFRTHVETGPNAIDEGIFWAINEDPFLAACEVVVVGDSTPLDVRRAVLKEIDRLDEGGEF
jgi:hypothetical protein